MSDIRIVPLAPDDKPTVANLVQLYLYDMTDVMPFPVGADGRFEYGFLERFWQYPFRIEVEGEIAGFALTIEGCPITGRTDCRFMAEFFVLKAYRRKGVGRAAVDAMLAALPGQWHVATPRQNQPAMKFWRAALAPRVPEIFTTEFEGDEWVVNSFAT